MFLTCLFRSLNQNHEHFELFCENLIEMLSGINKLQPTCSILVGDFNAKLSKWFASEEGNKDGEGMDTFTTTLGYTEMIGQLTHIINNKSSCIDLLFTTNNKLLCGARVE